MRLQRSDQKQLPCPLTHEELLERSKRMSWKMQDAEKARLTIQQHKDKVKGLTENLANVEGQINDLAKVVREESEDRPVDVDLVLHDAANAVLTIRRDTGEVIKEEGMSKNQQDLAFTAGEDKLTGDLVEAVRRWVGTSRTTPEEPSTEVDAPTEPLADQIKAAIMANGDDGLSWSELDEKFMWDLLVIPTAWTMVHCGELQQGENDCSDILYKVSDEPLKVDISATLEVYPDLGTEEGMGDKSFEVVMVAFNPANDDEVDLDEISHDDLMALYYREFDKGKRPPLDVTMKQRIRKARKKRSEVHDEAEKALADLDAATESETSEAPPSDVEPQEVDG